MSSNDDLDINLESAVLLALSKLQKESRGTKKQRSPTGISCKKIVGFLKANCSWVDGDVESQVMTALLSCVKTGIVCALDNQKFLLLRATAKNMISNCVSRVSHGPKCCCLSMLKSLLKTFPGTCCFIKRPGASVKKIKKPPPARAKRGPKTKSPRSTRKKKLSKPVKRGCAQEAQRQIGTSKSNLSIDGKVNDKCSYCMEIHSLPKLKKHCMRCYPIEIPGFVSADKFSPRDECNRPVETVVTNVVEIVAENT